MISTQGKREVAEAVAIAAFTALATGLINWGIERAKEAAKASQKPKEPDEDREQK